MDWKNVNITTPEIQEYLNRIDVKQRQLAAIRPLPQLALRKIKSSMSVEWTYNSNSIEGNTLTLQETKLVIEDGMTVNGKSLREHFEVVNHQEAIDFIYGLVQPDYKISERDILHLHSIILQKIEKESAGRYRNSAVRISGANFIPPNPLKVYDFMEELVHWVCNEVEGVHPLIVATLFHHRFVWIHPFIDGNGRSVRLLFNLLLMKSGYPPAIILRNDRKKYYSALNKADDGDFTKLFLLIAQAMERSLNIYLSCTVSDYPEYQPIQNIVGEDATPYGQEYVSLLARRGKIDAYKEGRVWYTTEEAVNNYMATRKRIRKVKKKEK